MADEWFEQLFGFQEESGDAAAWARTRARFTHDPANNTLLCPNGATYAAGPFTTPSLAELRAQAAALLAQRPPGPTTLTHAVTDGVLPLHAQRPGACCSWGVRVSVHRRARACR